MCNKWNKDLYEKYIMYLKSVSEENYKNFHSKLCFTKYEILGIRLPIQRKIVKKIIKTDIVDYLKYCQANYYEEVMIEGLVIASIEDETLFDTYFLPFINKIDNWAICDSFCNSLKIIKKNPQKYFKLAINLSLSSAEFISRTGLIIILNFFIDKKYLKKIFILLDKIKSDKYYINMAESWLICEIYTKYPQEAKQYLLSNKLNKFTHNKAISKIRESYRIPQEEKDYLNTLKRK